MAAQELKVQEKQELAGAEEKTQAGKYFAPYTDIHESADAIIVTMDMPGVDRKNVEVEVEKNILNVVGRIDFSNYEGLTPLYTEYNIGNYNRQFSVSNEIDTSKISASMVDGVLTVTLPKVKQAATRRIEVN